VDKSTQLFLLLSSLGAASASDSAPAPVSIHALSN